MLDNYFNLQAPQHNDEDLHNLLFKQLIIEAFTNNEESFDKILFNLARKDISLFDTFTMYPEYSTDRDGNDINIERNSSDYGAFISASLSFIKDEKYIIKLINHIKKPEIEKNQEAMTVVILGLLDNNFKNALSTIIKNDLFTEKEIKLKLILPENPFYYHRRKLNFHTFETEFLSDHIHELKITNRNIHKVPDIFKHVLNHVNTQQYKNLASNINKIDFSNIDDFNKKLILKILLEFGILQPNQLIGEKQLLKEPKIEVKSFLELSSQALQQIIKLQSSHLEKRLNNENTNETTKDKIRKI